ncbi:hypothetical protein GCK72_015795 [Caenorhabditis remanei]|uniref:Uncharacterized protein n=1 Tax=Caenorhabditis remanei TaxID=31234 RepID=A0A6A5GV08_CAERE|nr:hypothetical protein GCK72_015795 [Caenorhabditis remanei]KAF1759330.1 hypothetical protein GCK72_015795 [Caenorhabditis remanei]
MAFNVDKLRELYLDCQEKIYQGLVLQRQEIFVLFETPEQHESKTTTEKAIIEVFTHLRNVVNYTPCFGLPEIRMVAKESDIPDGTDHVKFGYPFGEPYAVNLDILRKQINGPDVIRPFFNIGNQYHNNYGPRRERMGFDWIADHDMDHEKIRKACRKLIHDKSERFSDFQYFILAVIYSKHCLECFLSLMRAVMVPKHALALIRLAGKEVECKTAENEMNLAKSWRDDENKKYGIPCWRLNRKYVAKLEAQVRIRVAEMRQNRVSPDSDHDPDAPMQGFIPDLSDDEDEGPIPDAIPPLNGNINNGISDNRHQEPAGPSTMKMPKIEGRPKNGVEKSLTPPPAARGNGQEMKPGLIEDSVPKPVADDDIEEGTVAGVKESLPPPPAARGNGQEMKPGLIEDTVPGPAADDDIEEDTVATVPPPKRGRGRPLGSTKKKRGRKSGKTELDAFSEHNYAATPKRGRFH